MLTFDEHIDVWADDTKLELHYIGTPAHTTNDVVAWLPERKVLFAGDLRVQRRDAVRRDGIGRGLARRARPGCAASSRT